MTASVEDAIAVVGLAGRLPGADSIDQFWQNTLSGCCRITRRTDPTGALLWARGQLHGIDMFDPTFFGMSPREALTLDPQHRVLLECAWQALEDAAAAGGVARRGHGDRTAVFAGSNYSGYRELLDRSGTQVSALEFESGTDKDFLATRIAYRLDLQGPCMTVQTACSSSLVAVHLACQSLLEHEADQALAGGVSIVLPHTPGWRFEPQGIHSNDGVCRPFDADANGTVMGDGAGVVVLRRLEDAIADGCRIYAVIRGSAVNNDGARTIGYAAPSVAGQIQVVRAALARAGVRAEDVGYVETHGTGTPLGDRVEVRALAEAFAVGDANGWRCALGSAKGALGHLDIAAGVVGLIRAALALHHAIIPGTVNHRRPHPGLALEGTPFHIPPSPQPWDAAGPRRAGVSSFGVGGTNAHVVLEAHLGSVDTAHPCRTLADEGYRARRHWPAPAPAPAAAAAPAADPARTVAYLRAVWREWTATDNEPQDAPYSRVLLLADADEVGDALGERLRARGSDLERISAAEPD
ncbi:MAG: polyketide synthase, partial [Dehalococcoidia bacterium]